MVMSQNRINSVNMVFMLTVLSALLRSPVNSLVYALTGNDAVVLFVSQLVIILPSVIYLFLFRMKLKDTIRFKGISVANIVLLVVFSYLIVPGLSIINALSMMFANNYIQGTMTSMTNQYPYWISILVVALIPCILEESVYRGVFFNTYRKANTLKGILLSAFLFGIMHMNINQFMYAVVMGAVFALLIEATDSILASMIVHFVINGSSITYSYILPKLYKYLADMSGEETKEIGDLLDQATTTASTGSLFQAVMAMAIPAVVCTILAVIVFRAIAQNSGRWEYIKNIFKGKQKNPNIHFFTIPLIIGILICIALMIAAEFV